MAQKSSNQGTDGLYDLITVILLIFTVIVACGVIVWIVNMPPTASGYAAEPTLFVFPTETPTLRGPTPNATWTPSLTPPASITPTTTRTPVPSITPTPTNTPTATNTLTPTLTPTITPTLTPSNTPTATQRAQYDFELENNTIVYTQNTYNITGNNAGCNWSGIGGRIVTKSGGHITGIVVRLTGGKASWNTQVTSGQKSPNYGGSSGWEFFLNADPKNLNGETFIIWLQYSDGVRASADYTVSTRKSCDQNLALAVFIKLQDRATATP